MKRIPVHQKAVKFAYRNKRDLAVCLYTAAWPTQVQSEAQEWLEFAWKAGHAAAKSEQKRKEKEQ